MWRFLLLSNQHEEQSYSRKGSNGKANNKQQPKSKGLTPALGNHVFTIGKTNSMDTFKTTWIEITTHCGTVLGEDVANELRSGTEVVLDKPDYTQEQKDKHADSEKKRRTRQERIKTAMEKKLDAKTAIVNKGNKKGAAAADKEAGLNAEIEVAQLTSEIEELQDQIDEDLPIQLVGAERERI